MKRFQRLERIRRTDPVADALEIYRFSVAFEFPWDYARALELALYRTYAVPGLVRRAVRTRGRLVRLLPPRRAPHFARQSWEIKRYPSGYRLTDLGTRPVPGLGGCPVRHLDGSAADAVE